MGRSRREFEQLARAHLHPLFNLAVRLTRQPQDAEDLVQETLLRAYRFFDKYEPGSNFKAWLFKILKNSFINQYRKDQREPETLDFGAIEQGLERLVDDAFHEGRAASRDPERIFLEGVLDEEIESALRELPPEYRMVLILAVMEEMSYKEIASALSIPIGTVMSRLHRARRLMQARLMEYARRRGLVESQGLESHAVESPDAGTRGSRDSSDSGDAYDEEEPGPDRGVVDISRFRGRVKSE